MIDMDQEDLVSLREVPRLLPRRPSGKKVHISAVYRWVKVGLRGVRLEVLKIGGTTYTSRQALQRFAEGLSRGEQGVPSQPRPSAQRERAEKEARAIFGAPTKDQ